MAVSKAGVGFEVKIQEGTCALLWGYVPGAFLNACENVARANPSLEGMIKAFGPEGHVVLGVEGNFSPEEQSGLERVWDWVIESMVEPGRSMGVEPVVAPGGLSATDWALIQQPPRDKPPERPVITMPKPVPMRRRVGKAVMAIVFLWMVGEGVSRMGWFQSAWGKLTAFTMSDAWKLPETPIGESLRVKEKGVYHVKDGPVEVRGSKERGFSVVGSLPRWSTVQVERVLEDWVWVTHDEGAGWVPLESLGPGAGERAFLDYCERNRGGPLENGEVIEADASSGPHSIIADNRGARDGVIVRVVHREGLSRRSVYVAPGQEAEIGGLASGDYDIYEVTGENFSRTCGRFLKDMQTVRSSKRVKLVFRRNTTGDAWSEKRWVRMDPANVRTVVPTATAFR